jgi:hypothetical protein
MIRIRRATAASSLNLPRQRNFTRRPARQASDSALAGGPGAGTHWSWRVAALSGASAVGLGAVGSHALPARLRKMVRH